KWRLVFARLASIQYNFLLLMPVQFCMLPLNLGSSKELFDLLPLMAHENDMLQYHNRFDLMFLLENLLLKRNNENDQSLMECLLPMFPLQLYHCPMFLLLLIFPSFLPYGQLF